MTMYRLKNGFFVDTETGVEYCYGIATQNGGHFYYYPSCPRYRSDGSLYVLSVQDMWNQIEETKRFNEEKANRPINI